MRTGIELLVDCAEMLKVAPICICDEGEQCWTCMLLEEVTAYLDRASPGWRTHVQTGEACQ